jgi:urocanate hydratase
MGGVARRSWARNENAMSTVSEFNDSHGNQGFSITEPFVADDAYIKSLINK